MSPDPFDPPFDPPGASQQQAPGRAKHQDQKQCERAIVVHRGWPPDDQAVSSVGEAMRRPVRK